MNKLILVLVDGPDPKSSLSSGMVRIKSSIARPWWIVPGRPCEVGSLKPHDAKAWRDGNRKVRVRMRICIDNISDESET